MDTFETIIGLEIHVQLKTKTKIFCGCKTLFGSPPNTQVCPVCLGFPGVLPVLNKRAMFLAIKTALALNCSISKFTKFDRKHYYYPDLPKNYQISQYDLPFSKDGFLNVESEGKVYKIGIRRVHLEEDAGKLIHDEKGGFSLVDFNRSGIPLLEIVSEPHLKSPTMAYDYLLKLKSILEYLEVSDCNMEEGSLRCDANISVRPKGQDGFGVKVELKNMNSFKAVKMALEYEVQRQIGLLKEGSSLIQETRFWDTQREITISMRSKEEAFDYRYFPEPDLPPFVAEDEIVDAIKASLPELPDQKRTRFKIKYQLSDYDIEVLTRDRKIAEFFEAAVTLYNHPKEIANWLLGDISKELNERGIDISSAKLNPEALVELLRMIHNGTISGKIAKTVLTDVINTGKSPEHIVKEKSLMQISDHTALEQVVEKVISENRKSVDDFKSGKENAIMFLVGQVMRQTKGKANPKVVNELLRNKLQN